MKSRRSSTALVNRSGTAIDGLAIDVDAGSRARLRFRNRWQVCGASGGKQANQTDRLKNVSNAMSVRCS